MPANPASSTASDQRTNVADRCWQHATERPEAIALLTTDAQVSYGELASRSAAYGGMLRESGIAAGDRVLLVAPTVGEFVVAYLGVELDPADLRTWAKERLSAYKVPHRFAFTDQLPKGATGKILERALDPNLFTEKATR
ncbi:AMP-binding protein [Nocardia sp. NPDC049707]|uniref:AMP-binding protein n=1 Tax=Nocardia sp. NPDC049707 TaxID=3154735 RepID=UPI003419BD68